MNPSRSLYARITINGNRTDLGFTTFSTILLRAAEVFRTTQSRAADITITMEVSAAKLPDSSILNKEQIIEQAMAAQIITDENEESPFEGVSIGRVREAMASLSYSLWAEMCDPEKRIGFDFEYIEQARLNYERDFPDCAPHFPKYIES